MKHHVTDTAFLRQRRIADEVHPDHRHYDPNDPDPELDLGFLITEPAAVYHARRRDYVSSHQIADFRRCPRLFRRKQLGLVTEAESAAYAFGRAAHTLILEGRERFDAQYVVGPPLDPATGRPLDGRTRAGKAWLAAQTRPVVSARDAAAMEAMRDGVLSHIYARELLAQGVAEGVVRASYLGVPCQARIDWINPVADRGIVDLKTCDDLDAFERDAARFGYANQLAFYRSLVFEACGRELEVALVAVEKKEPYRCGVWTLSEELLDRAELQNDEAVDELMRCRERDRWPTRYESLRLMEIGSGAFNAEEVA